LAFKNTVVTLHDGYPHQGESVIKRMYFYIQLALIYLFVKKIIVHSDKIIPHFPAWFRKKTFYVITHIYYKNFYSKKYDSADIDGIITLLFFGRILPYKGLPILLKAFEEFDATKYRLIIAGEGKLPKIPVHLKNIQIKNRFIEDEEISELFSKTNIVVLPYLNASQSGVVYMAFAFNKPVIVSGVGAIPDVIRDGYNGRLVLPGSVESLVDAITDLSVRENYRRIVENIKNQDKSNNREVLPAVMNCYNN